MARLSQIEIKVLRTYTRAVVHMRRQLSEHRFGLIFGAGVGNDLKLPSWRELIDRIADHKEVAGKDALQDILGADQSLTIQIQKLYEFYRYQKIGHKNNDDMFHHKEKRLIANWRRIITECLYEKIGIFTADSIKKHHPYLGNFVNVIERCDVTVNYNFDETLQVLLSDSHSELRTRRYKTISKGVMRPRSVYHVIYHPNGFLPRNLIESTDPVVFTEESFADQLLQMNQNMESFLLNHLSTKTCLLVGLSLNDPNLKHILRRGATANPGQCHYYICFYDKEKIHKDARVAITNANFQVYNLVTIFLNRKEIAALGSLLSMDENELRQGAEEAGIELKYVFYVTGPMGVGKSTCLANLYSLTTYDEWTRERLPTLAKDRHDLKADEEKVIRSWLDQEFFNKNWNLTESKIGIHLVDRPPLDPLAFTNRREWAARAMELFKAIQRPDRSVQPGHIILLLGEPAELQARIISQNKLSSEQTLSENQKYLQEIYQDEIGVTIIDTRSLSVSEVVHQIAGIIHLWPYEPSDLHQKLSNFANPAQAQFNFNA